MSPELLESIKRIVEEQANDEGLWFIGTATEVYLQQALRKLHEAIDNE